MTRIAVIGGTSAFAGKLLPVLAEGSQVLTLGRNGCDIHCDLLDAVGSIRIPIGTDAVVHLAAAFGGSTNEDVMRTVETNIVGTLKVCMAAKKVAVRHLVVISSAYAPSEEGSPNHGIYSMSKRHADELAIDFCRRYSLPLTVLRPSPLYGEEDAFRRHQPFLYQVADRAERGEDIRLFGKRDALRNYLHADDLARVVRAVLETRCTGTHLCAFPRDFAVSEIAAAALSAFGRGGIIEFEEERPDIPDNVFGNDTELYETIGFVPRVDIWEGMRRVARFRKAASP